MRAKAARSGYVPSRGRPRSYMTGGRVREFSSPAVVSVADDATLTDIVRTHATATPDAVLFRRRPDNASEDSEWTPVSAAEFFAQVEALAADR